MRSIRFSVFAFPILTAVVFIPPATLASEPTFTHDVAPILYQHCVSCHHPNDIAPMSLLTYKDARPWAAAIKLAVVTGKMPPWKADPHVGKWANDPSLSEHEKATILAWVNGSKLEATRKKCLPLPSSRTAGR